MNQGKAIIFSAPSGSGKTTIVHHLIKTIPTLAFSVSATTRKKRAHKEVHGRDYYFLTEQEFREKIRNGEFVEWEEVYDGSLYGTLKSEVKRLWDEGKHVVFDVDVKGGLNLKNYFTEKGLAVFVKVSNLQTLEERLRHRNTESDEVIQKRLKKASYELAFEKDFDITVISRKLENTLKDAENIVLDFIQSQRDR